MRITGAVAVFAALCMTGGRLSGAQASVPNLVCRGEDIVSIRNTDLKTDRYRSTDIYRFVGGKLYISSEGRGEYFYNDVRQNEPGRFTSAHKTIVFDGPGFKNATAVHTDEVETRGECSSCGVRRASQVLRVIDERCVGGCGRNARRA